MNASRPPLPVLHLAVVLLWAVLLGASWLVCGRLAPASSTGARLTLPRPELPAAALGTARGAQGLTQCPPASLPPELLSDARSAR
jgi:hypothetical protein